MSGGGQDRSAHPKAALLSGRRMGMDCRGRVVRGARAQPRAAHVLGCPAPDYRPQLSALYIRILRYQKSPVYAHNIIVTPSLRIKINE